MAKVKFFSKVGQSNSVMGQNTQDKEESKLQQNNAIYYKTVVYNTKCKIFTPCIILQNIWKGRTK